MTLPDIQKHSDGHYLITGELLMHTVPELARQAGQVLADASGQVLIDLSGVSRADSAGLALLMELQRLARRAQFEIRFQHLPDQLLQIVRLSELEEILPISA